MTKVRRQLLLLLLPRFGVLFLCAALFGTVGASAQQPAGAGSGSHQQTLPNSPQPQTQDQNGNEGMTSKVVGYMTNRSFFFPDIATTAGPLNTGEKFKLFVNESISPASFVISGVSAGFGQARNSPSADGGGAEGFGRRFGSSMARGASNSFFGTFLAASVLHQDPRFFPQIRPTLWGSIKYAATRIVVTRNDQGNQVFNSSGLIGPIAGETLANVYLPRSEQTGAKTGERIGTDLAWRFAGNIFKNYWPTLFHDLGLNKIRVVPNPTKP
jgi:hypothetical protein